MYDKIRVVLGVCFSIVEKQCNTIQNCFNFYL